MTKADKIKICRELMDGRSLGGMAWDMCNRLYNTDSNLKGMNRFFKMLKAEKFVSEALRWGLKHPEELRKGKV